MTQQQEPLRRAMVVVAHADDAEWVCSGTVARWCAEGWQVVYVLCTDGSKGTDDPTVTSASLVKIREREQRNAARVLGLHDVVFLGYEDAMLQPTLELRRDIVRQIRRYRPEVLVSMSPVRHLAGSDYFAHPDHLAAGEATLAAAFPAARDRLTFPELLQEGLEPHRVQELWIMDHHDPDRFVDVTDYMDVAIEALKQHQSQVTGEAADKYMREWRSKTGAKVGFRYAEAFKCFHLD